MSPGPRVRRPPRASLAALALAAALLGPAPAPGAPAPPAIAFDSEVCDLGSIVQGEQPECLFHFTNAGGADLHILEVEPTCGCTTALPGSPLLRAGERERIRVVFDSGDFAGEVLKEVEVRSNDPARPALRLQLRARVEPEIEFEPAVVTFDAVRLGPATRQLVALTNRRAEPVRVLRLEAQPSSFGCVLPSWTEPGAPFALESWDRTTLEVRFSPPQTLAMPIAGECLLEIEGPRKRSFRLKLLALPAP